MSEQVDAAGVHVGDEVAQRLRADRPARPRPDRCRRPSAPTLPSAWFIACASAWTAGGWPSPAMTRLRAAVRLQVLGDGGEPFRLGRRERSAGLKPLAPTSPADQRLRDLRSRAAASMSLGLAAAGGGRRARRSTSACVSIAYSRFMRRGVFRAAPRGEVARVAEAAGPAGEEVGVEREDDVGLVEAVLRVDVLAEGELRARARVLAARRIPLMPLGRRKLARGVADLRGERRRADRLGEDAEAGALERLLRGRAPRGSRRETPTTGGSRRGSSASASGRDRRGRGPPPARTRRWRRGCPGAAGCLRSSSAAPRGFRRAGPVATPPSVIAVAKKSGLPGMSSSGCRTYGTIFSAGCRVQAVKPASASDAPISFRNVRRATGSVIASICDGNSLCRSSRNAGSSASSSSVRQSVAARVGSARPPISDFVVHRWHVEQLVSF